MGRGYGAWTRPAKAPSQAPVGGVLRTDPLLSGIGGARWFPPCHCLRHGIVSLQRVTVSVTGTPLLLEPEDAVTVTVEVPAGVPEAGGLPLLDPLDGGGDESLPLQLAMATTSNRIPRASHR